MSETNSPNSTQLAADAMLGSLAQYLLLAGCDTRYSPDVGDDELRKIARQGRVVLTRDRELYESLPADARVYVERDDSDDQFRRLVEQLKIPIERDDLFTRCTDCNEELINAEPNAVDEQVPSRTRGWIDEYWQCPECETVYWRGSHYEDIVSKFEDWDVL